MTTAIEAELPVELHYGAGGGVYAGVELRSPIDFVDAEDGSAINLTGWAATLTVSDEDGGIIYTAAVEPNPLDATGSMVILIPAASAVVGTHRLLVELADTGDATRKILAVVGTITFASQEACP